MLQECLEAIARQSFACERIIVIDNASSDGTFEMLTDTWAGRVEVHALAENIGAAGGFNVAMRMGYRSGADMIWLMDDDVIPEPDALQRLLDADEVLESHGVSSPFLISTARAPNGLLTNVPEMDRRLNALSYQYWPEFLDHKLAPVTRATFVSILIPRETLQRHGLPIKDMFIWGEDTEFTLRVTTEQPGWMVGDSRVVHVRQLNGNLDIRTEVNPVRIRYHFHLLRNRVYNLRRYGPRRRVFRHVVRQGRFALKLLFKGQAKKAQIVLAGTLLGLSFNPAIEAADSPFDLRGVRSAVTRQEDGELGPIAA